MKQLIHNKPPGRGTMVSGFTLTEIMVAMAIFSLVIIAMVSVQLFGMRVYTLAATKVIATTGARETLNAMRDRIRSANIVMVGIYNPANAAGFVQITNGLPQIGNALEIQYTNGVSTNNFVFYKDPSNPTNIVCSLINGTANILAKYVTNYYCFQAEDYQGNVLTNYDNNPVIRVTMQFSQWEYPIAVIGGNAANAYDYYQLRTRVARREK
ncbi:MAG TPA: prepilin-type N-terminal cleavage/methylation domain-containing protein [Verrucomicrobiae bacterium]|nr:prepilin-type N-terminal cleavage/methylation domain-containing protein [Verrucomicrobiae bacterium]